MLVLLAGNPDCLWLLQALETDILPEQKIKREHNQQQCALFVAQVCGIARLQEEDGQ